MLEPTQATWEVGWIVIAMLFVIVILAEFVVVPQKANKVAVCPVKLGDIPTVAVGPKKERVPASDGERLQSGSLEYVPGFAMAVKVSQLPRQIVADDGVTLVTEPT